jgi:hypothetical protein
MKHFLLATGLLSLASCSKSNSDPTPASATTPSGHYTASTVYLQFDSVGSPGILTNNAQADFSGGNVIVSPGIFLNSAATPATTAYTLSLPILAYAAQSGAAGRSDSLINVTATSFTWIHHTGVGSSSAGGDVRIFADFTR